MILRKGGVSKEHLLESIKELGLSDKVDLNEIAPKHSKPETD